MWCKKRHAVVTAILRPVFKIYYFLNFNCKVKTEQLPEEGAIIISNHTTTLDPILVGLKFNKPIYYMSSKHIFQNRFIGRILKFLVNPIPKEKTNKSDIAAIKTCIKITKEKGSICIFPEGNRTYDGHLCHIDKSIIKLVKHLKQPLIICNIIGGYGSDPRWANSTRKGKLDIVVKSKYTYDYIKNTSDDELYEKILSDLTVDDFSLDVKFKGRRRAECLESVLYICPICKSEHTLRSLVHDVYCTACNNKVTYNENLTFSSDNPLFPFKNVHEWYEFQLDKLNRKQFEPDQLIFSDTVRLVKPQMFKKREELGVGEILLYDDRFKFILDKTTLEIKHDDIDSITLIGNKIMDIYSDGTTYRVKSDHKTNLIKYMNTFYILKSRKKEREHGFVGI